MSARSPSQFRVPDLFHCSSCLVGIDFGLPESFEPTRINSKSRSWCFNIVAASTNSPTPLSQSILATRIILGLPLGMGLNANC